MELLERGSHLDALNAVLVEAVAGNGRVALVSGEAGIGKTALVERLAAQLPRCIPLHKPQPEKCYNMRTFCSNYSMRRNRYQWKGRNMTLKEILLREIETLPESRQENVLAYVRFLKVGLAELQPTDEQFAGALNRARTIAAERGITEQDIETEINAARTGQ